MNPAREDVPLHPTARRQYVEEAVAGEGIPIRRELLVRWRSAWEAYYALSAGRRTKPQVTDIALHLPRPKD